MERKEAKKSMAAGHSTSEEALSPDLVAFGARLYQVRVKLGRTQPELAMDLKVKRQTVSSWEQGKTSPDVKTLLALKTLCSEKISLDLGELLGERHLDIGKTPLSFSIDLLSDIDRLGVRGVYPSRSDALIKFSTFLEEEKHTIYIVASSFMGLLRVAPEKISLLLKQKAGEVKDFRVLMTHPSFGELREGQEQRQSGSIELEIKESIRTLQGWGLQPGAIKFFQGAPTVFLLATAERMILNPYTYMTEAFKTMTLEVNKTQNTEDIFSQYMYHHFKRPWESDASVVHTDYQKGKPRSPRGDG